MNNNSKYKCVKNEDFLEKGVPSKMRGMREQLDWIKRQLEYANNAEKYKLRYELKKGEIYRVDWGININAELSNIHYGVVLADSSMYDPLVIMCPIKTIKCRSWRVRNELDLGNVPGLSEYGKVVAAISQVRSIDKFRIVLDKPISEDSNSLNEYDVQINSSINRLDSNKLSMIINSYYYLLIHEDD